jgi:ubiquinone/menaquinone biosynthesis C-methylase UbiE
MVDSDSKELQRATRYARYVAPTLVNVARRALDLAVVEAGNSVLDLGTATGLGAFLAAERAGRDGSIIGLDSSEAALALARERSAAVGYDYIHWRQGPPAPLPFADESFDAVLSLQALHTFAHPFAVLEEVRRVLVEGGRLVVTLWGSKSGNEWMGLLEQALRQGTRGAVAPPAFPLTQPGNLEALLQSAEFEEIEVARATDRMRFASAAELWDWANAVEPWAAALGTLAADQAVQTRAALEALVADRARGGEITIGREIVYARGVAPEPA